MTRRQYLVFLAWLPYESARIEFQPPKRDRRGPEKWRVTKEQAKTLTKQLAKQQFIGLMTGGATAPGKKTTVPR